MRFSPVYVTLLATSVSAFRDTSPFFLFSTSSSFTDLKSANIAHSSITTTGLLSGLSKCPSDAYILVSQPAVASSDFAQGARIPHLRNALNGTDGPARSAVVIPEMVGAVDVTRIQNVLVGTCGARVVNIDAASGSIPPSEKFESSIILLSFPPLPTDFHARAEKLADHDAFLHAVLTSIGAARSFTVMYTTTPLTTAIVTPVYEMDHTLDTTHVELRRAVKGSKKGEASDNRPLFEKYTFVTPAIFMGLFAVFILSSIGYVGVSALQSLQVSYFAFSKEMGPQGHGKKQQ